MADASKLGIFFVFLAFSAVSCENDRNDVIPDVYVDFTIDVNDYPVLLTSLGSVTVDKNDLRIPKREYAAGFKDNGIIIFNGTDGFYAFDRTCPHDYEVNKLSAKVVVDFLYAVCPVCSTYYALPSSGIPSSGPGKYYLKNYKTYFDGRFLRVWNY